MVEHLVANEKVAGSNPVSRSINLLLRNQDGGFFICTSPLGRRRPPKRLPQEEQRRGRGGLVPGEALGVYSTHPATKSPLTFPVLQEKIQLSR